MSRWRLIVLAALFAAPFLFLIGYGAYALWRDELWFWVWWPMAACLAAAYLLGLYWQRSKRLLSIEFTPPLHWTERDREAWALVEARAKTGAKLDADTLSSISYYVETAQNMALELARFYHPRASDPVGNLTVPEILAVVELAAHDLAELVDQYLPGGHLLTINDWRRARRAADWYQTASNVTWLISALFSPFGTAVRYLASHVGMTRPWQILQQNLFVWFHSAFVHRLGTYLIELNSGRLRVGATRYRQLLEAPPGVPPQPAAPTGDGEGPDPADAVRRVSLAVLGQTKVGKSSLINAVLGEQRARTDVIRATEEITRYELQPPGIPTVLEFLDTVGYGHTGPRQDQVKATAQAAQHADLILLVLHARNPARQADLELLNGLKAYFAARPELNMPRVLGVVTHIDLLSPALEWTPPYDWQQPERPKEQSIRAALDAVQEQLGDSLIGVVPVCTAPGREHGVQEWLLPALVELLDQAHAVAFLRALRAEADTGKVRKVFHQLLAAGKQIIKLWWRGSAS